MVSTSVLIYTAHALSAWGDRVWYFAIPLFLTDLDPNSLFLTAVYGLALSLSVFVGSPLLGKWIDKTQRLKTMGILLTIQNTAVVLSATLLVIQRKYGSENTVYETYATVIVLGSIGMLASQGCRIAIQRDWIVVVAAGESDFLAQLNAITKRIDLLTKILAPMACGNIMTLTSLNIGALFICAWNVMSLVLEYYLLRLVYKRTPELAKNKKKLSIKDGNDEEDEHVTLNNKGEDSSGAEDNTEQNLESSVLSKEIIKQQKSKTCKGLGFFATFIHGYRLYFKQPIAIVGVARAFMFLTVMGFGYLMISFVNTQCISEFSVGIVSASCAISGIMGTFLFPILRSKAGLVKTGMISGIYQSLTFIPALVSLFSPGSIFVAYPGAIDGTDIIISTDDAFNHTTSPAFTTTVSLLNVSAPFPGIQNLTNISNYSDQYNPNLLVKCPADILPPVSFISMILLFVGIIAARAGLMGFDLSVTQLFQENIKETERGIVNGVQTSIQTLMEIFMYTSVMYSPKPKHFGFLMIFSAVAVTSGHIMYGTFAISAAADYDQGGTLPKNRENIDETADEEGEDYDIADGKDEEMEML